MIKDDRGLELDRDALISRSERSNESDDVTALLETEVEDLKSRLELQKFYFSLMLIIVFDAATYQHLSILGITIISIFEFGLIFVFSKHCNVIGLHDSVHACSEFCIRIIEAIRSKK